MIKSVFMLVEESKNFELEIEHEELLDIFLNKDLAVNWIQYMKKEHPQKKFSLRQREIQMSPPDKKSIENDISHSH